MSYVVVVVIVVVIEVKLSTQNQLIPSLSVCLGETSKAVGLGKPKTKYITQQNYPLYLNFDTILIVLSKRIQTKQN